jgi:hypothetical protein
VDGGVGGDVDDVAIPPALGGKGNRPCHSMEGEVPERVELHHLTELGRREVDRSSERERRRGVPFDLQTLVRHHPVPDGMITGQPVQIRREASLAQGASADHRSALHRRSPSDSVIRGREDPEPLPDLIAN